MDVRAAARRYAELQSAIREKKTGKPMTEEERTTAVEAYAEGARYALKHAETAVLYSSRGAMERIREMREETEKGLR